MTEWSVLIKVRRDAGQDIISRSDLEALLAQLPGSDKGVTGGDGQDATLSFWIEASDATSAILDGWQRMEEARGRLALEPWTAIRTHAASAAQRLTGFRGIDERVGDDTAWSALVKAERGDGGPGLDADVRARLAGSLGADATVVGEGTTVVARFWVVAPDAGSADGVARAALEQGLDGLGLGDGWSVVRAHHAVAHERAEELYRGADERAARDGS